MNIDGMLETLQKKIAEISQLKSKIQTGLHFIQDYRCISQSISTQLKPNIQKQLKQYDTYQRQETIKICKIYDKQIIQMKYYYEYEIQELKNEISRQYKVIGMMKKQVEDLMLLVNYHQNNIIQSNQYSKQNNNQFSHNFNKFNVINNNNKIEINKIQQNQKKNNDIDKNNNNTNNNKYYQNIKNTILEIIQEQDTQRTIISSARSNQIVSLEPFLEEEVELQKYQEQLERNNDCKCSGQSKNNITNNNHYKNSNQQNKVNNDNQYKMNNTGSNTRNNNDKNEYEQYNQYTQTIQKMIEQSQFGSNMSSQTEKLKHDKSIFDNIDFQNQSCIRRKQLHADIIENNQLNQYQSVPLQIDKNHSHDINITNGNNSQCTTILKEIIKVGQNCIDMKDNYKQPKNKQFLEEFRRTFNKCLTSMQASKKNSTKINNKNTNSYENQEPQMITFGKHKQQQQQRCLNKKQHKIVDKDDKYHSQQNNKYHSTLEQNNNKIYQLQHEESNSNKMISNMLKQLDNNNKFIVGTKKIQLRYEGDKKNNNIRHGNGNLYFNNGLCYQGEFKNGIRYGYGVLKFNHIEIYNGDWQNDQICGQGKIRNCAIINKKKLQNNSSYLSKWISYCGDFRSNRFDGQGTLYLQGGQKFLGRFVCGLACGDGTLYKKNGQVETGIWKNNQMLHKI